MPKTVYNGRPFDVLEIDCRPAEQAVVIQLRGLTATTVSGALIAQANHCERIGVRLESIPVLRSLATAIFRAHKLVEGEIDPHQNKNMSELIVLRDGSEYQDWGETFLPPETDDANSDDEDAETDEAENHYDFAMGL